MTNMLDFKVFVFIVTNALVGLVGCATMAPPQYLGGSLTFNLRNDSHGKHLADVELTTRWVLNSGPCGHHCDQTKIGDSTLAFRTLTERFSKNPYFFGLLSVEYQKLPGLYERRVINDLIKPTMSEVVSAVGENWEEDRMKFTVEVDPAFDEKTMRFDGYSWANLTLQGPGLNWNLKSDNTVTQRPDTKSPNTSPKFMSKQLYRTKLGHKASLRLVSFDDENDRTVCEEDFGTSTYYVRHVPGITVNQDCTVDIDTNGYSNNTMIAVPIKMTEHPISTLTVNNRTYTNGSPIGSTGLQFVVQVIENVDMPAFVTPTHNSGHEFIVLEGDTWSTKVYAKPGTGKNIADFRLRTLYSESVSKSPSLPDMTRPDVKLAIVSWTPTSADLGKHIVCVSAVDSDGETTVDDVCYILNVIKKVILIGPPFMTKHYQLGQPIMLDCLIAGTSKPTFYWQKESGCDKHIETFNGPILNVTAAAAIGHRGTYICVGSDGMYQNVTKRFYVKVDAVSPYYEACSLENGVCGWEQRQTDTMDWALIQGPTQTSNTGPDTDHTIGDATGYYFYMETSSPIQLGDSAALISHLLPANLTLCFNFWYNMYGDGVGSLSVHIQDSCTMKETTLFTVQGEQGTQWLDHQVDIPDTLIPNDYRIIIEGIAGSTFRGDIGLDDFEITEGQCVVGVPVIIG